VKDIKKFKDISTIFNIERIEDNRIYIKEKEKVQEELIYQVVPISMLNYAYEDLERVINIYVEFLKSIDVKFKILIRNIKFDKNQYLNKHFNNLVASKEIYKDYINSIRLKMEEEEIYSNKIYICFICKNKQDKEIEDNLNRLNSAKISILKPTKEEIINLLYSSINKI